MKHLYLLGIILCLFAFFFSALMLLAYFPLIKLNPAKTLIHVLIYAGGLIASVVLVNYFARKMFDEK
ncbi:MAG: hypothetical protein QXK74_08425 [Candidatus Nitrosocaldaceae archaeon]